MILRKEKKNFIFFNKGPPLRFFYETLKNFFFNLILTD
jgi:hypothetical protein